VRGGAGVVRRARGGVRGPRWRPRRGRPALQSAPDVRPASNLGAPHGRGRAAFRPQPAQREAVTAPRGPCW
jgi:hypothetical protein